MPYSSQAPPYYSSTPMENENVPNVGLDVLIMTIPISRLYYLQEKKLVKNIKLKK